MKKITIYAAVSVLCLLAVGLIATTRAADIENGVMKFSAEEQQKCEAEGGCALVTRNRLQTELRKAFEAGKATGKQCQFAT